MHSSEHYPANCGTTDGCNCILFYIYNIEEQNAEKT